MTRLQRSKIKARRSYRKHCKSGKVNGRSFVPTKAVIPIFSMQPTLVAIPQANAAATQIFTHPQEASTPPDKCIQQTQNFCCICTPSGRKCPNNYKSSDHPEWSESNPESEEDWDGDLKREEERKKKAEQNKQEQRPRGDSYYPPSPQYVPSSESDNFAPPMTNTLVPVTEEREEEEGKEEEEQEEEKPDEKEKRT